jgi:23S rRNA (guanosine2251-2'-O)-methyltransferase
MEQETQIYGIRAVLEALEAGRAIDRIYLDKGLQGALARELQTLAKKKGARLSFVPTQRLERFRDRNHQGVVATISPVRPEEYQPLIDKVIRENEWPLFLLLDGVSDVRNLGAIIRTAACTGVHAIILPQSGGAPITADTVKTSAGAVFKVPLGRCPHIKDAVFYLQASGVQIVTASEKAEKTLYETNLTDATALVMGSEEKGVSPAILKIADQNARLPMSGSIASLNVSVACGVFLYEVVRQRLEKP